MKVSLHLLMVSIKEIGKIKNHASLLNYSDILIISMGLLFNINNKICNSSTLSWYTTNKFSLRKSLKSISDKTYFTNMQN
jgi:hypothetical protein